MGRPGHWMRGTVEQVTPGTSVAVWPAGVQLMPGETLDRLHFAYQLVGNAPGGSVIAQYHPGILGVLIADIPINRTNSPVFGPWASPNDSNGLEWYWWEGFAWEHWQPVIADNKWRAPRGAPYRDVHAKRVSIAQDIDHPAFPIFWYQQDPAVDWVSALYVSCSAFILDAP